MVCVDSEICSRDVCQHAHFSIQQVLELDHDLQKTLAPFLKRPALRRVIQTFTNDAEGNVQKWAGNQEVIKMLTEAKRMLDEGLMTEAEMDLAFASYCQVSHAVLASHIWAEQRTRFCRGLCALGEPLRAACCSRALPRQATPSSIPRLRRKRAWLQSSLCQY